MTMVYPWTKVFVIPSEEKEPFTHAVFTYALVGMVESHKAMTLSDPLLPLEPLMHSVFKYYPSGTVEVQT